jgi:hypothetical protein
MWPLAWMGREDMMTVTNDINQDEDGWIPSCVESARNYLEQLHRSLTMITYGQPNIRAYKKVSYAGLFYYYLQFLSCGS